MQGIRWSSGISSPIVMEMIQKYLICYTHRLLEIGCGEGRDSRTILKHGYQLMATDISDEAIAYCKTIMPQYANHFSVLDCLSDKVDVKFDFIYAIAVIHMLVLNDNTFLAVHPNYLAERGISTIDELDAALVSFLFLF